MLGRVQHDVAVGGVKRRLEERAVDGFEKDGRLDALRFGKDECFAERLDHGADEEVAAELDGVGLARLGPTTEMPREKGLEQGGRGRRRRRSPAATIQSLPSAATLGRPKTGAATKSLAAPGVLGGETLTERDADGAAGDVKRAR